MDYAPNALGQATRAGTFASSVAYYANGGMRQFVYGNGIAHYMQQNLRQLPEQVSDHGVLDHVYSYDGSGNVLKISDALDGGRTRSMSYDGLDRLTKAVSTSFGGNGEATYSYDALDNLRASRLLGVRQYNYWYDAANRLSNIVDDAGATIIGFAYDAQGNLAIKNGQQFTFDFGNRLREAVGKEAYRYDAQGRRVVSSAPDSGNIISMYGHDGLLRRQDNDRQSSILEYVYLNGSLVAKVSTSTAPAAPVVSAPANSDNGTYTVSWSTVVTAARYELEQRIDDGPWLAIYSGSSQSLAMSGRNSGIYSYRARSCRSGGCGEWGNVAVVSVQSVPTGAPGVTAPERSGDGSYVVTWTAVTGAVSYRLEERVNSDGWASVQNSAALSLAFASKTDGSYAYRVSACNATGCGGTSGVVVVQVLRLPGGIPAISAPQLSGSGDYAVGWSSVTGASRYRFEESVNGAGWTALLDGPGTSYVFSQKADGVYAYRVAACNAAGCAAYSPVASTQVRHPPGGSPSISVPGISSNGSFVVSWTAVAGADSYRLQESAGGTAWIQLQDAAGLQASLSGRGDGSYAYRVSACNTGGCSGFSAVANVQVVRPPGAPVLGAPGQSNNGTYTVNWSSVPGAGSYVLEESVNGGGWSQMQNSPATSFAVAGKGEGSYSYRVLACNPGGCGGYSGVATVIVIVPPATPSGVTARYIVVNFSQPWQVRYFVNWNPVPGATTYEVQSNRGNYSGPLTSIQINYVGTPPGGTFSVRACKSGVCSAWSPSVTANGG
ncbi:hypothetical protein [Stenotrophomonas maltophilia]|uniref:hypothetical protein n=1 Tax=Stenotrophomonas maltophilia TaxID=40324 RepID=UPI0021AC2AE0|nr:hypothetical protein [Stenotrophomonas maltophilia]